MNVRCTQCHTVFRVDPAKVPVAGVRARCSVCSGVFWVRREMEGAMSRPEATMPPPFKMPAPAPPPAAPSAPAPVSAPRPAPPRPASAPPAPAFARPMPPGPPAVAPARPSGPPAPAVSPVASPPAAAPPPSYATPSFSASPAKVAAAPAPSVPAGTRAKRPINPFLSQDPNARARRLARALVSDIVVYHPAKRRDGLRDGSLKLLFEEEIRKSWDEYVEQVGRELAEATTFFTDALNEILADGQSVFP